jgi:3-dehydroquinate synthetase
LGWVIILNYLPQGLHYYHFLLCLFGGIWADMTGFVASSLARRMGLSQRRPRSRPS